MRLRPVAVAAEVTEVDPRPWATIEPRGTSVTQGSNSGTRRPLGPQKCHSSKFQLGLRVHFSDTVLQNPQSAFYHEFTPVLSTTLSDTGIKLSLKFIIIIISLEHAPQLSRAALPRSRCPTPPRNAHHDLPIPIPTRYQYRNANMK